MRDGCVFSHVESVPTEAGKTEEVRKCFLDSTALETLRSQAMEYRALNEYVGPTSYELADRMLSNEAVYLKEMERIENECRAEANARRVEGGDWNHGFRSGCQVAIQLVLGYLGSRDGNEEAEAAPTSDA